MVKSIRHVQCDLLETNMAKRAETSPRQGQFIRLNEQERVEALLSYAGNSAAKALTLWVMEPDRRYYDKELGSVIRDFLGGDIQFRIVDNIRPYCRTSLGPMGFITENKGTRRVPIGRSMIDKPVNEYMITYDGQTLAKPAIARFLLLADELGVSLNNLNGATKRNGKTSSAYAIAKVLEVLADQGVHTARSVAERIESVHKKVVLLGIKRLAALGLVDYKGTGIDTYKAREAELTDADRLERYLANDAKMRAAVRQFYPRFTNFSRLRAIMELRLDVIGREPLFNVFAEMNKNLNKNNASEATTVLCRMGVYKFRGETVEPRPRVELTEVKMTERGRFAFEFAYKPILFVARYPRSDYANGEYQSVLKYVEPKIRSLFSNELVRFSRTNGRLNKGDPDEYNKAIINGVEERALEEFRIKDLVGLLRIPTHMVNRRVRDLYKSGRVEKGKAAGRWRLVRRDACEADAETPSVS